MPVERAELREELANAVGPITERLTEFGNRFGRMETSLQEQGTRLGNLENQIRPLGERINTLEHRPQGNLPAPQVPAAGQEQVRVPADAQSPFTDEHFKRMANSMVTIFDQNLPDIKPAAFEAVAPATAGIVTVATEVATKLPVNPLDGGVMAAALETARRAFGRVFIGENAYNLFIRMHKKAEGVGGKVGEVLKSSPRFFMDRFTMLEGRLRKLLLEKDNLAALDDRDVERMLGLATHAYIFNTILERRTEEKDKSWKGGITMLALLNESSSLAPKIYKYLVEKYGRSAEYVSGLKTKVERAVKGYEFWQWVREGSGVIAGSIPVGIAAAYLGNLLFSKGAIVPVKEGLVGQEAGKEGVLTKAGEPLGAAKETLGNIAQFVGDGLRATGDAIGAGIDWVKSYVPIWFEGVKTRVLAPV